MSSTRRAAPGAPMSQARYSSSATYERGLLGNLVAVRCKRIKRPEDRALVYFIQGLSHQEGGLEQFTRDFFDAFGDRFGTPSMHLFGIVSGQSYSPEQMELISREVPLEMDLESHWDHPIIFKPSNLADKLVARCREAAGELVNLLKEICLDPALDLELRTDTGACDNFKKRGPQVWWFRDLWGTLHDYRRRHIKLSAKQIVTTAISKQIFYDLAYAAHVRGLVVIEGPQRTGKTTSAENWCEQRAGEAVFVELESGNDDATFFRTISIALGTACTAQRKATDMRMRIEDTLQTGHRTLVISEAHFLWPQISRPRSAPSRIDWLRTALVDKGVGVALVSTPQFYKKCALYEKELDWNAAQLKGRVKLHTALPPELPEEDLRAVARHMVPQADEGMLLRLVGFALISDDYLAGIERLVSRAGFFAAKDGRSAADGQDIAKALDEAMPRLVEPEPPAPESALKRRAAKARAVGLQTRCNVGSAPPQNFRRPSPTETSSAAEDPDPAAEFEMTQR